MKPMDVMRKKTLNRLVVLITLMSFCFGQVVMADTLYYVHTDHLGTPVVITDGAQATVWKGDKSPFGETTATVNQIEFNVRFPGQYYDVESGLHYNYFRDYDPATGRYIQSDPIGLSGGINSYGYTFQNPLSYSDPTGEIPLLALILLAGGLTVGASNTANAPGVCDETYTQDGLVDAIEAVGAAVGLGVMSNANKVRKAAREARRVEEAAQNAEKARKAAEQARNEIGRLRQVEKELREQLDNGRRQAAREIAEGRTPNPHGLGREINESIPNEILKVQQKINDLGRLL